MFFNWFIHSPRRKYDRSTSPLRVILMILAFGIMCWAFWANSERYTTKFSSTGRFSDEIGAFNEKQKDEITAIIGRFSRNIQVKLRVTAQARPFTSPDAIEGEVLFGISPENKQVVIFMPPLWRAAVGDGFIYQLRSEIMEPAFDKGDWQDAAIRALLLMEHRFDSLAK